MASYECSVCGHIYDEDKEGHAWDSLPDDWVCPVCDSAKGYFSAKAMRLDYADAAPAAMIGASNHFEVAIATATVLFGISSGAALATVVGVLIEVPVMLMLVRICLRTRHWFPSKDGPEGRKEDIVG